MEKKVLLSIRLFSIFIIAMGLYNLVKFIFIGGIGGWTILATRKYLTPHHAIMITYLFWGSIWLIGGMFLIKLKSWARKFIMIFSYVLLIGSIVALLQAILLRLASNLYATLAQTAIVLIIIIFLSHPKIKEQFR